MWSKSPAVIFTRKTVIIDGNDGAESTFPIGKTRSQNDVSQMPGECTALVVNSSYSMAKEITLALTLEMPSCSIMYAPSLQLARWILKRRKVNLVVSSSILPDGNVSALVPIFESMETPPDLVVVGNVSQPAEENLTKSGYRVNCIRHLGDVRRSAFFNKHSTTAYSLTGKVKELGADIRNDLNNPLQAIVAMVFVAQAGGQASPTTLQALDAIDRAARGMATVVNKLEAKIREAVIPA